MKGIIDNCRKQWTYKNFDSVYVNQIEDKATKILDNTKELKKYTSKGHRFSVAEALLIIWLYITINRFGLCLGS